MNGGSGTEWGRGVREGKNVPRKVNTVLSVDVLQTKQRDEDGMEREQGK